MYTDRIKDVSAEKEEKAMIHIAIVEDEQSYVTQFTEYLRRYEQESGNRLNISVFRDGEHILNNYKAVYDIILMDIQMRLMDGMTAAEKIRKQDQDVVIIFITNMTQYAIRGYAVDALDYVLKPVTYFAFSQRLDRAIGRIRKKDQYFLVFSTREGSRKVAASQVYYVESQGHTLVYHTKDGNLSATGTMKDGEESLRSHGFSRCNKGYLVNLEYVEAIRNGAVVVAGEELVISRGRKAEFMEDLTNHIGEFGQ
ncbi:MAG: LytTR family DNA-binding domain-containing protein [Lachnospiraceae bacterium]|nr:LytTR family DNA-binding domain-containing protein [Lachnospiraceae bacterium]